MGWTTLGHTPLQVAVFALVVAGTVTRAQAQPASWVPTGSWVADAQGCKLWTPSPAKSGPVQWSGACEAGHAQGAGELRLPGGTTVSGTFVNGRLDGQGSIDFANGDRFVGLLREGVAAGSGRYTWAKGDSYEGEFASGQPWGQGDYRHADGSVYSGAFVRGMPSGRGRLTLSTGLGYDGQFETGTPTTPGAFFRKDGPAPEDSLDTRIQLSLRYAATQLATSARARVSAATICRAMPAPRLPVVNWKGKALYKVVATVTDGKVTAMQATALVPGVPLEVRREFLASVESALRAYDCPGNHVFEQEFQFGL